MERHEIADDKWDRIQNLIPGKPSDPGTTARDNRLFVNAVLYVAKVGGPWRDLPARFGNWNSQWRRFDRLCRRGVWARVFAALQDPDLEWLFLDSTVVRAHRHAAGAKKKRAPPAALRTRRSAGVGAACRPRSTSPPTPSATRCG